DQLYKADFRRTYPEDVKLSHPLKPLTFETEKIKAFGNIDKVLEQFLLEQQQELEQLLHDGQYKQLPPNTVRLVLDAFVTEEGTKRPVAYEQTGDLIRTKTGKVQFFPLIPEEALSKLLQRLIDNRLLRQESDRLELSHDSLAALIDRARSDQERQVYQLQSRIVLAEKDFGKTKEYLGPGVLGQIDELLTDLQPRLEKKHLDFIAHSHDKQKEDLDVERDRLKREKNLIRSNRERRNQVVWIVIATVIVLALVFYSAQTGLEDGRENKEQAMKIEEQLRQIKELNQILKIAERDRDVFKAAWINDSSNNSSIVMTDSLHGLLKDHRDKKVYPIIRINDQLWMAKNLDYDTIGSWPNKKGDEFGRLYFGPVANEVCPDGWNLPSDDQWKELFLAFGGYQDPFDKGRVGKPEIAYNNLADNGFTLLPGDALNDSGGLMDSTSGFYWSSNGNIYYHLGSTKIIERRIIPEKWSMSCRCVKKKDK
ncbi:MAG: hypothetical protein KDD15_11565, partial [Lewinella sp.]|nr:hypothetical protein [Lewinella sp.]